MKDKARNGLRALADAALELAEVCDRDIEEFALVWHQIARNARFLEHADSPEIDDVRSLLESIKMTFSYHPGEFMEQYISRADYQEQVRENEHLDSLKKRVAGAAADIRNAMNITPSSF